jgi:hypothetical protein
MSDHPVISDLKARNDCESDEELLSRAAVTFAQSSPQDRRETLGRLSVSIGADFDDKTPALRQRAQLMDFTRNLENIHRAMKRAGR